MRHDDNNWKDAQRQGQRGVHVYISKTELRRLERDGALDAEGDIEYKTSVGVSDGRARAFIQLRNPKAE